MMNTISLETNWFRVERQTSLFMSMLIQKKKLILYNRCMKIYHKYRIIYDIGKE